MATAPQAVQPTSVTLAPTQPNVKAIRISQSDLEKIAVLYRGTNNWATWSDAMQNLLLLNHGGAYILGTLPHPNDTGSAANWDLNNLCIIGALCTRSTPESPCSALDCRIRPAEVDKNPYHMGQPIVGRPMACSRRVWMGRGVRKSHMIWVG
ncbi:hypothetical protein PAXRUDRAFT_789124 [Paxillus rubicundulus Ve08.2h10]|uniref:Unplaced genomic scaffold scaffold_3809, whole genome shotgun sequence n=1 Tax=Paxillus rubicundulus Ve08.2h10 TaxID=930991 RepID=A0A0D0DBR8_9AGAM|nr:hypothetical protein PAXRUDRAFT_789124 [Paxillus rubicundulus Ve08.2h10]